ncbi:uncharacterized protein LOC133337716, partial [Musca vetustissima]|uniref:uncharacterized protein LOC133337716 n=1 Tax=Musca vetustissima TaxID=27455 RepID=UPI002AB6E9D3
RWNSTYVMLTSLKKNKEFYINLAESHVEINIGEDVWQFIDQFIEGFHPLFILTKKKLQEEQLIIGNFFRSWLEAKINVSKLENNQFSNDIINFMEKRTQKLFDNYAFRSAVYIDPRFNFVGSGFFTNEQRNCAEIHISCSTNIFDEPKLYELVQILLGVSATQVSVERAFSALTLIVTARRTSLKRETLDNILILKLYNELIRH